MFFPRKSIADNESHRHVALPFLALMDFLDMLHSSMRFATDSSRVKEKVQWHLKRFLLAHGVESVIPKHHLLFHLAKRMQAQGCLLSCFVHERKHKEIKRFANELSNAGSWFNRKLPMAAGHVSRYKLVMVHTPTAAGHSQASRSGSVNDRPFNPVSIRFILWICIFLLHELNHSL